MDIPTSQIPIHFECDGMTVLKTTSRELPILPRNGEITDLETGSRPFARYRVTGVVWAIGLNGTAVRVMVTEQDWEGSV